MARNTYLKEHLSFTQARVVLESEEAADGSGKTLYMKGICIEGGVRNANERVYPVHEIAKAVDTINEQIKTGHSVLGEVDHPDDLKINLDRVSHMIENMWMDGACGYGKLKILPTPMGSLVKTMLDSGVKLGVSSRGSGNVNDHNGHVSDFEIVTVDIVAQPSAPNAYPTAIYEGLLNHRGGQKLLEMFKDPAKTSRAQRAVSNEVLRLIKGLKL
jgi:Prohead core protein serine protease